MSHNKVRFDRVPRGASVEKSSTESDWSDFDGGMAVLADVTGEQRLARMKRVIDNRTRNLAVVLEEVHDPHNIAAVLRSAESFGVQEVHIMHSSGRAKISDRITQGCEKWLDLSFYKDVELGVKTLRDKGLALYVASFTPRSVPLDELDFSRPAALVFGNEHQGTSEFMEREADSVFTLPMFGFSRSFNISVAVALTIYTAVQKRIELFGRSGDLPDEEKTALLAEWLKHNVRGSEHILARGLTMETEAE
jgi:tRNA (guanosine-2'-O-)-methyltransferase